MGKRVTRGNMPKYNCHAGVQLSCRTEIVMPDLIRHPNMERQDSGSEPGMTGEKAAVMPDLIRHPNIKRQDSGSEPGMTGEKAAVMPDLIRHPT